MHECITQECLRTINCGENPNLSMIPADVQSDSDLVLWMLRLHQSFEFEIDKRTKDYYNAEEIAKQTELEKLELVQEMEDLQKRVDHLESERPLQYIQLKLKARNFYTNLKEKISNGFSFLKRDQLANKIFPKTDF